MRVFSLLLGSILILMTACTAETPEEMVDSDASQNDITAVASEDTHMEEDHDEHGDEHSDEHDDTNREHGAHEHGVAELLVAWSGKDVAIDLRTPSYNVLGFEYVPATDAERELLESSKAVFEAGSLLQLTPEAECVVITAVFETELAETGADEDQLTHSEIDVAYNIECEKPENLQTVDISALFTQFPNFQDIETQWVSDNGQSAVELTPDNPVLDIE